MIEIRNLTKHFGPARAVEDVSFSVKEGEVLGFLGPNGAGKSTTMKMITGFLAPTSGTAVAGADYNSQSKLRDSGPDVFPRDIRAISLPGFCFYR